MKRNIKQALKIFRSRWYVIIILLLVAGFLFYRQFFASSGEKNAPYSVKSQTLKEELTFSGQIDAEEKADLQFQSGGRLAWVGVKEGDYVNKYQAIASLDQRQLQKTLEKYLNTYTKELLDLNQQKEDTREVVIGGLTYDQRQRVLRVAEQAQYDLNNAVLDVELQNIAKEYANLFTPIEGVVDHVEFPFAGVNIGISTSASDPAYRVVNPNTLFFAADVDQTDLVKVQEGQEGEITFDAYPDETTPAVVKSIAFSPQTDETGTIYEVEIDFLGIDGTNESYKYRLGMTGDLTFVLKQIPNVISVPSSYLKSENGKQYVFKDVRGKSTKTFVTTGETLDNQTIIKSGLQKGDVVYD